MISVKTYEIFQEEIKKHKNLLSGRSLLGWQVRCTPKKRLNCIFQDVVGSLTPADVPYPIFDNIDEVAYSMFARDDEVVFEMGCGERIPVCKKMKTELMAGMHNLMGQIANKAIVHQALFADINERTYPVSVAREGLGDTTLDKQVCEILSERVTQEEMATYNNNLDSFVFPVTLFSLIHPVRARFLDKLGNKMLMVCEIRDGILTIKMVPHLYKQMEKQDMMDELFQYYRKELDSVNWWPDGEGHLHGVFTLLYEEDAMAMRCRELVFAENPMLYRKTELISKDGVISDCWMLTKPDPNWKGVR